MPERIDPSKADGIDFGGDTLVERPTLTQHIGVIASIATTAETLTSALLTVMLGAEADLGAVLVTAIENEGSRIAVLKAISERCLAAKDQERFGDLLKKFRQRRLERNDVVHGIWGISPHPDYANALVWIDPRDFVRWMAAVVSGKAGAAAMERLFGAVRVYREHDFTQIEQRLKALHQEVQAFWIEAVAPSISHRSPTEAGKR